MSQTTVNLGHVPVNRGEYSSSATYYRDNIVQYRNSSYICNIEEPDVAHPVGITGVAPYDSDPATPNTGWAVFANDSSGVGEGVYNVSVDHTTDNQPKVYASLSAALRDVPQAKKKGGMEIRFIFNNSDYVVDKEEGLTTQPAGTLITSSPTMVDGTYKAAQLLTYFSTLPTATGAGNAVVYYKEVDGTYTTWTITLQSSDNKYVQYFLTKNTWSTTESDWERVDLDFKLYGEVVDTSIDITTIWEEKQKYQINSDGVLDGNTSYCVYVVPCSGGVHISGIASSYRNSIMVAFYNGEPSSSTFMSGSSIITTKNKQDEAFDTDIPTGAVYVAINRSYAASTPTGTLIKLVTTLGDIDQLQDDVTNLQADVTDIQDDIDFIHEGVDELDSELDFVASDLSSLCSIANKYIQSDGSFRSVGDTRVYFISDYIPIKNRNKIYFKSNNLGIGFAYALYDSSKEPVGSAVGQRSFDGIIYFNNPDAKYIVLALNTEGEQRLETGIYVDTVINNETVKLESNILPSFSNLNKRFTLIQQTTPKNLFTDFSKFVYGKYIDNSGSEHNLSSAAYYNDLLPIPSGETKLTIAFSYQHAIALYDENEDFIQCIGASNVYDKEYDLSGYPTAKFVKINTKCDTIPTHTNYDGIHPCYAYFGKKYDENEQPEPEPIIEEIRTFGNVIKKPIDLNGKNITFFGDSITEGYSSTSSSVITNGYAKLLCDNFGAIIDNKGKVNTRICDPDNSSNSILNRVLNYSGNPDIIIIAGGTNDYGHDPQSTLGEFNDSVYSTLYGALNLICQHLKTNYPSVPVIFITPINRTKLTVDTTPTLDFNDLRNAIWRVAVNNGYSVIDGSKIEGFPKFGEASLPVKTQLLADGLHPTDIGHEYMANYISGVLG